MDSGRTDHAAPARAARTKKRKAKADRAAVARSRLGQPAHATKRTCPKYVADQAAQAAAGPSGTAEAGTSGSQ